ncbi:cell division protein FtsZ [Candidatus Micrarchaeota archaeon CG1_02_60_51]|nr:MAG: cell division protein FtsZ [Candidatus Micrarchaeota archaeon CG1_02_60_51]PIO02301.1 MAG: cell division protein FtsZ [Candidatus Micrarchaeota archaeon CG09_land_8_20_14_0_10_60_16]
MEEIVKDALKTSKVKGKAMENEMFDTPKIMVIGTGGGGCNSINRLAKAGIKGAEMLAINTDQKHLTMISESVKKMLIGASLTRGLGAGGYPETGAKAAEMSREALERHLNGADLVFLTAGMGGGTGTGSAPIIADIAKKQGAIVISIVTYPFALERARLEKADQGLDSLKDHTDTLIIIDNNRLVQIVPNLPIDQAFNVADEIIARAVRGITETITTPSLINLDFADVRAIMSNGGLSMIAVGEAKGTNRATEVVKNTLENVLLDVDYTGATGVLLHITGGPDMTLGECNQIGESLTERVDPNATVIWGARLDPTFEGKIEAIAIFTGIRSPYMLGKTRRDTGGMPRGRGASLDEIEFL